MVLLVSRRPMQGGGTGKGFKILISVHVEEGSQLNSISMGFTKFEF